MSPIRIFIFILFFSVCNPISSAAQLREPLWLDIGDLHHVYEPSGAVAEQQMDNQGMQWPAFLRLSGHSRSEAFWIGVQNWTDESGEAFDYTVFRNGPRTPTNEYTVMEHRLMSRWPETTVEVNGAFAGRNEQVINDVDPDLPADRVIVSRIRTPLGIEVERKVYAFGNPYHDDYHIIERTFSNTGNTDEDDALELPGQVLNEVYFFNIWRWAGRLQAGIHGSSGQRWGKFNMVDVVGDGNEEYPVDFTAIYSWAGYDPAFSRWNNLGSPMIEPMDFLGDTTGRLAGMSMQGLVVLHADNTPADATYNPLIQPKTLGFINSDDNFLVNGAADADLYNFIILTRENPTLVPGGASRMYPHYADRVEPGGLFWNPSVDASQGKQGGHSALVSYGPYTFESNQQVRVVEALVADGLSYQAADEIGRAYKRSGTDDQALLEYDANGDGVISDASFAYEKLNAGAERLTKNQWYLTARDSMYASMDLAREVWDQSSGMSEYLFGEVPPPPARFEVMSEADAIHVQWDVHVGARDPVEWELYRTTGFVDNQPYQLIATFPGSARAYEDMDVIKNVNYFYHIQAVGEPTTPDPSGITGTPSGAPFKSSLYYTQTYVPARLRAAVEIPPLSAKLGQNNPNPFDQSTTIPFAVNGPDFVKITVVDLLGREVITLLDRFFEFDFADDIVWDGRDQSGRQVPSGIYYCQVTTAFGRDVVPMVVAR